MKQLSQTNSEQPLIVPSLSFAQTKLLLPNHMREAGSLSEASKLLQSPRINGAFIDSQVFSHPNLSEELRDFWQNAELHQDMLVLKSRVQIEDALRSTLYTAGLPQASKTLERTAALKVSTDLWINEMIELALWTKEFAGDFHCHARLTSRYTSPAWHIDRRQALALVTYDGPGPEVMSHNDMENWSLSEFDYNITVTLKKDAPVIETPSGKIFLTRDTENALVAPKSTGGGIHRSPKPVEVPPFPHRLLFAVEASVLR